MLYNMSMVINSKIVRDLSGMKKVAVFEHCSATFDEIGNNDAVIALSQDNGVGRGDHKFYSPKGGLYIVMRAVGLHINAHTLAPSVGLAVHDAVKSVLGIETSLKWVNDVMKCGKKVAGILCKCPRRGEYLIGVGINYATDQSELDNAGIENATTLCAPENRVSYFVAGLLKRMRIATLATFDHKRYSELCMTVGKNISFVYNGTEVRGYAESVAADGSLVVRMGAATVVVDAGEVSIVREIKE